MRRPPWNEFLNNRPPSAPTSRRCSLHACRKARTCVRGWTTSKRSSRLSRTKRTPYERSLLRSKKHADTGTSFSKCVEWEKTFATQHQPHEGYNNLRIVAKRRRWALSVVVGDSQGHFRFSFCLKGPRLSWPAIGCFPGSRRQLTYHSLVTVRTLYFVIVSGPESSAGGGIRAEKPTGRDRHRPGAERHRRRVLGCNG